MDLIQNNIVFEVDGTKFNVPLIEPWNIYTGPIKIAPDILKHINYQREQLNYIVLYVTNQCNLKCSYCFDKKNRINDKETEQLNIDDFVNFLRKMNMKKFTIRFFGGEPLIRLETINKIIKVIEEERIIRNWNVNYNIFTNGTIVNNTVIKLIEKYNLTLFLSIDGTKEMHDKNRRYINNKGSYDKIIKNMKQLITKYPYKIVVRSIIDISQPEQPLNGIFANLFNEGFNIISFEFPWINKENKMALDEKQLKNINLMIKQLAFEIVAKIKMGDYHYIGIHPFLTYLRKLSRREQLLDAYSCGAGAEMLAISTKGELYPCHAFVGNKKYTLGNLQEGITNNKLSKQFHDLSADMIDKCRCCPIKYLCSKRCPADALLYNGSIFKPNEVRCEIEKIILKYSFYIYYSICKENIKNEKLVSRFYTRGDTIFA